MSAFPEPDEQLVLKPGETLVICYHMDKPITPAVARQIVERFKVNCPGNECVVIHADGISISEEPTNAQT